LLSQTLLFSLCSTREDCPSCNFEVFLLCVIVLSLHLNARRVAFWYTFLYVVSSSPVTGFQKWKSKTWLNMVLLPNRVRKICAIAEISQAYNLSLFLYFLVSYWVWPDWGCLLFYCLAYPYWLRLIFLNCRKIVECIKFKFLVHSSSYHYTLWA
jgi:hypothetical protein